LSAHVDGARGENVDDAPSVEWLMRARADFGLDEWNMPQQAGSAAVE
jgi:hypothetical protein